jgi:hypothetical protein
VSSLSTSQCPTCSKTVVVVPGEDADATWQRHSAAGDCHAADRRDRRKRRCAADGCRLRLNLTNGHTCSSCGVEVCLRCVHDTAAPPLAAADAWSKRASPLLLITLSPTSLPPHLAASTKPSPSSLAPTSPSSLPAEPPLLPSLSSLSHAYSHAHWLTCRSACVCCRHRYADQHACAGAGAAQRAERLAAIKRRSSMTPVTASSSNHSGDTCRDAATTDPRDGPRAAVVTAPTASRTPWHHSGRAASGTSAGTCPTCSTTFVDTDALLTHAEVCGVAAQLGLSGASAVVGGGVHHHDGHGHVEHHRHGVEVCPTCRASFDDVAALISHVEAAHVPLSLAETNRKPFVTC